MSLFAVRGRLPPRQDWARAQALPFEAASRLGAALGLFLFAEALDLRIAAELQ